MCLSLCGSKNCNIFANWCLCHPSVEVRLEFKFDKLLDAGISSYFILIYFSSKSQENLLTFSISFTFTLLPIVTFFFLSLSCGFSFFFLFFLLSFLFHSSFFHPAFCLLSTYVLVVIVVWGSIVGAKSE